MAEPVVVTGGSIAALACADTLAAAGRRVEALVPEKGLGAGFAPLRRDGHGLELGVRLLELRYEGAGRVPALRNYHPAIGGHRAYTPLIADWVAERAGDRLVETERPRMVFDGRVVDDLYFTTDPTVLRDALGDDERAEMAAQARYAAATEGDAGVLASGRASELAAMTLAQASKACHGVAFHERFAEPYAAKIVEGGTSTVLAALRRKTWTPLFWPRTLAQACGAEAIAFAPERPFHTIAGGGAGQLVDILRKRLTDHPLVELRTVGALQEIAPANGAGVRLRFAGAAPIHAQRPVIGNAPAELFAAVGVGYAPDKARSVIVWLEVDEADLLWAPSLLNVVDPDVPIVRISSGGWSANPGRRILTAELSHDQDPDASLPVLRTALERYGVLAPGSAVEVVLAAAAPTFALPSAANVERFAAAHTALAELALPVDLVGGAVDFAADALNEQIVQALKLTEERTSC